MSLSNSFMSAILSSVVSWQCRRRRPPSLAILLSPDTPLWRLVNQDSAAVVAIATFLFSVVMGRGDGNGWMEKKNENNSCGWHVIILYFAFLCPGMPLKLCTLGTISCKKGSLCCWQKIAFSCWRSAIVIWVMLLHGDQGVCHLFERRSLSYEIELKTNERNVCHFVHGIINIWAKGPQTNPPSTLQFFHKVLLHLDAKGHQVQSPHPHSLK